MKGTYSKTDFPKMVTDCTGFDKKFFNAEIIDATESNNFLPTYGSVTVIASAMVYILNKKAYKFQLLECLITYSCKLL